MNLDKSLDKHEEHAALAPSYQDLRDRYDEAARVMQARWNLTLLGPNFVVGAAIASKHMAKELEEIAGVSHVLCVAEEECEQDEKFVLGKTDMRLFCAHIGHLAHEDVDPADIIACWRWYQGEIKRAIQREEPLPRLYVHCHDGKHRSVGVLAFLLAMSTGKSLGHWLHQIEARHAPSDTHTFPVFFQMLKDLLAQMRQGDEGAEAEGEEESAQQGQPPQEAAQEAPQVDADAKARFDPAWMVHVSGQRERTRR